MSPADRPGGSRQRTPEPDWRGCRRGWPPLSAATGARPSRLESAQRLGDLGADRHDAVSALLPFLPPRVGKCSLFLDRRGLIGRRVIKGLHEIRASSLSGSHDGAAPGQPCEESGNSRYRQGELGVFNDGRQFPWKSLKIPAWRDRAQAVRAGHRCQEPQCGGTAVPSAFDLDGLFTSRGGADGVDWVHLRRGRPPTRAREARALVRRPGSRPAGPRVSDGGVLRVWRIVLAKSGCMPGVRLRRAEAARRCRERFLAHV